MSAESGSRQLTRGFSRGRFLSTVAIAGGAATVGSIPWPARSATLWRRSDSDGHPGVEALPHPERSGIEHVVLVMMENRSFDHFLGWLPHANGKQRGLSYRDRSGVVHNTYPLAPDFQGCGRADPDHSFAGARIEYDHGKCDGWLLDPANDIFCIGYYRERDLPFLGRAARTWTVLDNYHAAILGPTYPNRIYQHAAQTDRLDDSTSQCTLPTIWDRLAAAGLSGSYYFHDLPFTALWGQAHASITKPYAQFLTECEAGTLPDVAFVDPRFEDENSGTSGDDHPHGDIRVGEAFLNQVYRAVTSSPNWDSTVLIINFDEWGGFFDHVRPTEAPIPHADKLAGNTDGLRGFRVPCLVISPWSKRGRVVSRLFDHTSVLRMIEWRWGLEPLTVRDAAANNLAHALDFGHKRLAAPRWAVPMGPFGGACP